MASSWASARTRFARSLKRSNGPIGAPQRGNPLLDELAVTPDVVAEVALRVLERFHDDPHRLADGFHLRRYGLVLLERRVQVVGRGGAVEHPEHLHLFVERLGLVLRLLVFGPHAVHALRLDRVDPGALALVVHGAVAVVDDLLRPGRREADEETGHELVDGEKFDDDVIVVGAIEDVHGVDQSRRRWVSEDASYRR